VPLEKGDLKLCLNGMSAETRPRVGIHVLIDAGVKNDAPQARVLLLAEVQGTKRNATPANRNVRDHNSHSKRGT